MVEDILIYWILIFLILLVINLTKDSKVFGVISGLWLMLLGAIIVSTGIQTRTGMTITTSGAVQSIVYTDANVTMPYTTYSIAWGTILIGVSIVIIYFNARDV
jgi:hypothetical protein